MRHYLLFVAVLTLASCGDTSDESLYSEEYDVGVDAAYLDDGSSSEELTDLHYKLPDISGTSGGNPADRESTYVPVEVPEVYIPTAEEMLHGNIGPRLLETEEALRIAERQVLANEIASGMQSGATNYGDDCTSDCSGHDAGYDWAAAHGIDDPNDCSGNGWSFEEGCRAYADEQSLNY